MQKSLKESLSSFVMDVLLLQRTIREKSAAFQTLKQCLTNAAILSEASYLTAEASPAEASFKEKIKACQDKIREANYWLRVLREAEIGDLKKADQLITESRRIKDRLDRLSRVARKPLLQTNNVAA